MKIGLIVTFLCYNYNRFMAKRLLISLLSALFIISLATTIIFYGRGYRFDPSKQKLNPTGILSVSSYPEKASIYIDDKLISATNASLSLSPGWYQVKVSRDGYQSWEKKIRIQGEVVSQVDALLIPNNPSLKALTSTGINKPTLSHSGTKVAYVVTDADTNPATLKSKNGVYVLELRSGALGSSPESKQIFFAESRYDYDTAKIYWSADEKEIILAFRDPKSKSQLPNLAYLISAENTQTVPVIVTSRMQVILDEWQTELDLKKNLKLEALPESLAGFLATNSADIRFSPDETKILYTATNSGTLFPVINPPLIGVNPTEEKRNIAKNKIYVYDNKEDKNYHLADLDLKITPPNIPLWYTDSKHLVIVEETRINIVDYDGTNKRSVYGGPFLENLVLPWASGGKIVILTNLNRPESPADLYEVDLR